MRMVGFLAGLGILLALILASAIIITGVYIGEKKLGGAGIVIGLSVALIIDYCLLYGIYCLFN